MKIENTMPSMISVQQEIAQYRLNQINREIRAKETEAVQQEQKVQEIKEMRVGSAHIDVMA
jgi:electron transfer flavoprotein alpha/beta subunit